MYFSKKNLSVFVLSILMILLAALPLKAQIHVDANAASGGEGTSWGSAYNDLQTALSNATEGDKIWVAEGIYYPDEGL